MPGIEEYKITPDTEVQRRPDGRVEVTLSDADRGEVRWVDDGSYEEAGALFEAQEAIKDERRPIARSGSTGIRAMTAEERAQASYRATHGTDKERGFNAGPVKRQQPRDKGRNDGRSLRGLARQQKRAS